MKTFSFAGPLAWAALMVTLSAPPSSLAQDETASSPAVRIRFIDSATGFAIHPESIIAESHQSNSVQQRIEQSSQETADVAPILMERGRHTITAISSNHLPISGEVNVADNNPYQIQFMLDPIEKPTELRKEHVEALRRDDATIIQGFVGDEELRQPLAGVRVSSQPSGVETVSDARGFFRLHVPVQSRKERAAAPARLILEKQGYRSKERQYLELWPRGDSTYTIRLKRGIEREIEDERTLRRNNSYEEEEQSGPTPERALDAAEPKENLVPVRQATVASNATLRVPRNIRVEKQGIIYYMSFDYYMKHVLPSEWIRSWHTNSLNAGAVAVRSYALARYHNTQPDADWDICGSSNCQQFDPDDTAGSTDAALDYTANYVLVNASGNIVSTEYSSENNSLDKDCGDGFTAPSGGCLYDPICAGKTRNGHGRGMCQRGSNRWATGANGFPSHDWIWILRHYYPNLTLVKGSLLTIGDEIKARTANDCHVRACGDGSIANGINCTLITTKAAGETGVIIGGPTVVTNDGKGFTWYKIQWNDVSSTVGWSCENYLLRVFPLPAAPTNLTATAVATNRIDLSWADSDVETIFKIERAPATSGPWIEIAVVAANVTTYADTNLFADNQWFYRLRAFNANGDSAYSNIADATTFGAMPPTLNPIPDWIIAQGSLFTFAAVATAPEGTQLVTDFEPFMSETANGVVLFGTPTNSITTRSFINSGAGVGTNNLAAITDAFPISGHTKGKVLLVTCQFTNANNPWLRLTTEGPATLPSPVIDFTKKLRFNIRADREVRVALGVRETSTASGAAIGSNGGTSGAVEWVGVSGVSGTAPIAPRVVSSNSWSTLTFDFPNEPVRNFSGGNGILSTASGLGVLEHLAIVPTGGIGVYNIYLDNFTVIGPPKFTFSLGSGAPTGASIHPATGVFTWMPSPSQSPSTNSISIIVTDDNSPPLSATNAFVVIVKNNVPNSSPLLAPISNHTVNAGATVGFTNSAYDPNPGDVLTFSLDPGAPPAASINSSNGVFRWTTSEADADTIRSITVRVTDNGTPPLSGTASFSITVLPKNNPPLLAPVGNRFVHAGSTITFMNVAFDSNSGDVLTFSLGAGAPATANIHPVSGVFTWTTTQAEAYSVNSISVRVADNGFPPLSGTVVFSVAVYPELTIESIWRSEEGISVMWNAAPGQLYRIEYKTNLLQSEWLELGRVISNGESASFVDSAGLESGRYYRVVTSP